MILFYTDEARERLDHFLSLIFTDKSRSELEKHISNQNVKVNGKFEKKSCKLKKGDRIEVFDFPDKEIKPEKKPLTVLFEDAFLIILNKPKDLVVHPTENQWNNTLVNRLLAYTENLSSLSGEDRPGIVHRLDKDTTGALIIAKNNEVHQILKQDFQEHKIKKTYLAIVHGEVIENGMIDEPIGRHPINRYKMSVLNDGRMAKTIYAVLQSNKDFSLLQIQIETGRTHQIRVHLSHHQMPILGDPLYGRAKESIHVDSQMLHAYQLEFQHPITKQPFKIIAPLPEIFLQTLDKCKLNRKIELKEDLI